MNIFEKAIIFSLPLMKAFTIFLGFPLRIYELASIFVIFVYGLSIKRNAPHFKSISNPCAFFIVACIVSLFSGYFVLAEYDLVYEAASWRHLPVVSSLAKLGYILFVFALLFHFLNRSVHSYDLARIWVAGALFASLYGFYIFASLWIGLDPWVAPGQQEDAGLDTLVRITTFAEGNFASSYFLLSIILSLYLFQLTKLRRYLLTAVVFFLSTLQTQSTAGFISLAAVLLLLPFIPSIRRSAIVLLGICILTFMSIDSVRDTFFEKLLSEDINQYSFSRYDRIFSAEAAVEMVYEYPFLGVGLQNYGVVLPNISEGYATDTLRVDVSSGRRIVNNVYLEITSELGGIGLLAFSWMLLRIGALYFKSSRSNAHKIIFTGFFSILVTWIAYPTYTSLYHWMFLAIMMKSFSESFESQRTVVVEVENLGSNYGSHIQEAHTS